MYIIIWNSSNNDSHIHKDMNGFIEWFLDEDDAKGEAEENKDKEHFRDYIIVLRAT